MTTTTIITFGGLLIFSMTSQAQQNPQSQQQTTAVSRQADPCAPPSAIEVRAKQKVWGKIGGIIAQHAPQINRDTHGAIDGGDVMGAAVDAASTTSKPCVTKKPTSINPPVTPPPTTPEMKPVISEDGQHLFICPNGSTQRPELPICQLPDGRYIPMQELPVPPGSLKPRTVTPPISMPLTPKEIQKVEGNEATSTPTH
jgi:hypothetical protein